MIEANAIFKQPDEKDFEQIKQMVKDFWLYSEDMKPEQFRVISLNGKIIAFARLVEHSDAMELGTLGVDENFRMQGWGTKIVRHLLSIARHDIYVVTTIFKFNANIGFKLTEKYPDSIKCKLEKCVKDYHVEEPYFVMKWEKKEI